MGQWANHLRRCVGRNRPEERPPGPQEVGLHVAMMAPGPSGISWKRPRRRRRACTLYSFRLVYCFVVLVDSAFARCVLVPRPWRAEFLWLAFQGFPECSSSSGSDRRTLRVHRRTPRSLCGEDLLRRVVDSALPGTSLPPSIGVSALCGTRLEGGPPRCPCTAKPTKRVHTAFFI